MYSRNSAGYFASIIALLRVRPHLLLFTLKMSSPISIIGYGVIFGDIEKRLGIEQFGIGGFLSNGKIKSYDMFMQALLDIVPNYKEIASKKRRKVVYANYRVHMRAYMYSVRTDEENAALDAQENEAII